VSNLVNIPRKLDIRLPKGKSAILWGARKSGKSAFLKETFPDSLRFDFLRTDLFFEMAKRPALLRERILAAEKNRLGHPILLDEVQKVPQLLDEVQALIEDKRLSFMLCGSSARKLKTGHGNLLGGRAWRCHMHPLTWAELDAAGHEPELPAMLNRGLIPSHYLDPNGYRRSLQAYVYDYLKEEIMAEGLARNVPAFSRFLDAVAFCQGEILNHSNIARDSGVGSKTIREYFQILEDTLLGYHVEPFAKSRNREVILKAPKFYLFDVGVAGILAKRHLEAERGAEFGKAFEHLIFMELAAYRSYAGRDFPIRFWRTKLGLEVDFILGDGETAIEVKGGWRIEKADLRGLEAFREEAKPRRLILVCNEREPRKAGDIDILPWREFFRRLWEGRIAG
jgi:predicted AAA+ superfamily ATPase